MSQWARHETVNSTTNCHCCHWPPAFVAPLDPAGTSCKMQTPERLPRTDQSKLALPGLIRRGLLSFRHDLQQTSSEML